MEWKDSVAQSYLRDQIKLATSKPNRPALLFLGLMAASLAALLLLPPITQDQSYHRFADERAFFGVPNFWNVVSNLPFIAVGVVGLRQFHRDPATLVIFLGIFLTGFGSSYYHWDPSDRTLFWDRLPMTLCFMAIVAVVVEERVNARLGAVLSLPRLGAAAPAVPTQIFRHVLLGRRRRALCARQAVRALRPRGPCEFHPERSHAQAPLRGCCLFRGAEIFPDAPTDSVIARLSRGDRLPHPKPGNVQCRKEDQRQHRRDQQSTHDRVGHRSPKYRGCDRDHAEHGRYGGEHDGAEAGHRGLDHRIPYRLAFRTLVFDLIDEDHRIARDHPKQRQNAENGHEPERFLENEKRGDDPDQPHRNDAQDEEKTAKAVQLHHQDGDDDEQHQGNHREDRSLRLRALLDRPAHRNVIGPRQSGLQRCNRGGKRGNDSLRRRALRDVGLDGERGDSVAAPDQRKFPLELEGGELAERNGAAARKCKLQIAQRLQRNALLVGRPDEHVDEIDPIAHLGDRRAGHHGVEHRSYGLRAQPQQPRLVLIDADANLPARLHPIEIDSPRP